jgi:hypothetical protein
MSAPNEVHDGERACLLALANAWNAFIALEQTHPSDATEMCSAIHRAQDIVAARIARRVAPDLFVSHRGTGT